MRGYFVGGKCDGGAAGVSLLKSEFSVIIHGILHRRHGKIIAFYFPNPVATLINNRVSLWFVCS